MLLNIADVQWIHGAADCSKSTDPPFQSVRLDENTFILRQSKCLSFEAPFLYLLIGETCALLLDSGAQPDKGQELPVRSTVQSILEQRLAERNQRQIDLIVAHSHSHGDHVFGDSQFQGQSLVNIVPHSVSGVRSFFGLTDWPEGQASLDLGGRVLTILPLPGHEPSHIAVYDANTRLLLTGDTLYPGLLTVSNWPAYQHSAARLAEFASAYPISMLLGAHVEMEKTPQQLYPIGTTFQPNEHALPLSMHNLTEWNQACRILGNTPRHDVHDEFIIEPINV